MYPAGQTCTGQREEGEGGLLLLPDYDAKLLAERICRLTVLSLDTLGERKERGGSERESHGPYRAGEELAARHHTPVRPEMGAVGRHQALSAFRLCRGLPCSRFTILSQTGDQLPPILREDGTQRLRVPD